MKKICENPIAIKSKSFAIKIINLVKDLSEKQHEFIISRQIGKSGTSIGANIREGLRAQSKPDFISKMSIALKEASETDYWLELLVATEYIDDTLFKQLSEECNELISMLTSIIKTSKQNL